MPASRKRSRNLEIHEHRLRLAITVYDAGARSYRSSPDLAARLSAASKPEIRALWAAIVAVVEAGAWRDNARSATPGSRVSTTVARELVGESA